MKNMADREMIIKGCENWVKNHKDESLILAYSAVEDLLAVLKEQEDALEQMRLDNTDLRNCNAELLKEQEAMNWINVKDRLPNENGSYLVVYKVFQYVLMDVKQFAKDMCSVDDYDFPNEHRPGWYECDKEYGYIERDNITHWMPLPNLPEEGR